MNSSHIVAPSILAADFAHLGRDVQLVNNSEAQWIHVDVMDGMFVPNISFGQPIVATIAKHSTKLVDLHLMIDKPERYVEEFRACGAEMITVHYEATDHLHRVLQQIKATGAQCGVALNPHTPVELLVDTLSIIDMVCIMSVNPGFGGQKFIAHTYDKVRRLKKMIQQQNTKTLIEVDGGVSMDNASSLIEAGADVLVAGSSVFRSDDPMQAIRDLKAAL